MLSILYRFDKYASPLVDEPMTPLGSLSRLATGVRPPEGVRNRLASNAKAGSSMSLFFSTPCL